MSISQEVKYRLATIKFAKRFGVLRTSADYHTSTSSSFPHLPEDQTIRANDISRAKGANRCEIRTKRVSGARIYRGAEFTKSFHAKDENNHSMFEATAKRLRIRLKRIKPGTPKHNGKVERSHREDQKLFYSEIIRLNRLITDEDDFKRRLKRHQDKTNNRPMKPLGYKTPKQVLMEYVRQHNDA